MWIEVLKFFGFSLFWFVMQFLAILLSTSKDAPPNTLKWNYVIFVGIPLLLLIGYKIYSINKNDLSWSTEIIRFVLMIIVPLILAKLYLTFGKAV